MSLQYRRAMDGDDKRKKETYIIFDTFSFWCFFFFFRNSIASCFGLSFCVFFVLRSFDHSTVENLWNELKILDIKSNSNGTVFHWTVFFLLLLQFVVEIECRQRDIHNLTIISLLNRSIDFECHVQRGEINDGRFSAKYSKLFDAVMLTIQFEH